MDPSGSSNNLPKLAVFDLDETLWPWDVDGWEFRYPFKAAGNGKVVDSRGQAMEPYDKVGDILRDLHAKGVKIGVASRTSFPEGAKSLINLYGWNKMVSFKEIYPGCKITHFRQMKKDSGIEFEDMIFFDNENRNIKDVSSLGVICIFVDSYQGVTKKDVEKALKIYQERRKNS